MLETASTVLQQTTATSFLVEARPTVLLAGRLTCVPEYLTNLLPNVARWCILSRCSQGEIRFGNVGREFVRLLAAKEGELRKNYGIEWKLTGVASRRIGWIADPNGLDPSAALAQRWPEARNAKTPQ